MSIINFHLTPGHEFSIYYFVDTEPVPMVLAQYFAYIAFLQNLLFPAPGGFYHPEREGIDESKNGSAANDGNGNLSGYAWAENVGWISFSCQDSGTCAVAQYGVVIDPCDGTFSGLAWGENIGWVNFSSNGAAPFQIVTSWRLDTDGDGTPDCSDNCPSDPAKTDPGVCGCGVADTDTDADGTPDCSGTTNSGGGGGGGCFINSLR